MVMTRILDRRRSTPAGADAPDWTRSGRVGADDGAVDEIEMYVVEAPLEPIERHPFADTLDAWRTALAAFQDHAREINSPGGFIAPPVDFPTQTGYREDVQITLHADPRAVGTVAATGTLFEREVAGLRVDAASLRTHKTELAWEATLRPRFGRRRAAMLRIAPTPSLHITVIRLTPVKPQRIATRSFIRAGLRASYALADRLDAALRQRDAEQAR